MKGQAKMSEVKEVVAPALVYCNCTKKLESNMADESNFEIYRYLKIDPEGERNIFCKDQPFLFSDDWKPYINIDPFPFCQSEHYEAAVKSLMSYTQDMLDKAIEEGRSESEILLLGEEVNNLTRAYDRCKDQEQLRNKEYVCILQVVDHWFEVSKKMKVSGYFSWSQKTEKVLERINSAFGAVAIKARRKFRKAQPNIWKRITLALSQLSYQIEDLSAYSGFSRVKKQWSNNKNELEYVDYIIQDLKEILNIYTEIIHEELFFANDDKDIDSYLGEVKEVFLKFTEVVKELDSDDIDFKEDLKELSSSINDLEPNINQFSNMEKEYLNKNSFLVCRCGGIIRIVYDGQDLKKSLNRVYNNLIDLLKWSEHHLYESIFNTVWPEWQMPVSFIDGFNFVRLLLLLLKEQSQYNNFIRAVGNGKKQDGFGVEMNITITPCSVINKKEHTTSGTFNLLGAFLGIFANAFEHAELVSLGAALTMEVIAPSDDNAKGVVAGAMSAFEDEGAKKTLGDILGNFLIIKSLASAVADFRYKSTADYVGQIEFVLKVGTHDITYTRDYDIEGKVCEDKTNVDMRKHEKPKAGIDPSTTSIWTATVTDVRNYDNTLKLDTTLILDAEKVREIREYNINEGKIYEK